MTMLSLQLLQVAPIYANDIPRAPIYDNNIPPSFPIYENDITSALNYDNDIPIVTL